MISHVGIKGEQSKRRHDISSFLPIIHCCATRTAIRKIKLSIQCNGLLLAVSIKNGSSACQPLLLSGSFCAFAKAAPGLSMESFTPTSRMRAGKRTVSPGWMGNSQQQIHIRAIKTGNTLSKLVESVEDEVLQSHLIELYVCFNIYKHLNFFSIKILSPHVFDHNGTCEKKSNEHYQRTFEKMSTNQMAAQRQKCLKSHFEHIQRNYVNSVILV